VQSNIERKIRGLMAKSAADGVTEQEAATYAAHAAKLCLQYNIDQNNLKGEERRDPKVIHVAFSGAFASHPKHHAYLRSACAKLFGLICYSGKKPLESGAMVTQYFFIGLENNAEAGAMTFKYFDELIEGLLRKRKEEGYIAGGSQSNSYRKGASGRLFNLCNEATDIMVKETERIDSAGTTAMNQLVQQEAIRFGLTGSGRKNVIKVSNKDANALGYYDAGAINIHGASNKRISG
jgi:hypothetical protein